MTPSRAEFLWQLSVAQGAILGSIAHADPHPMDVESIFAPIRFVFADDAAQFAEDLFQLRAMGLVWINCETCIAGYTVEGRAHVEAMLAEKGTSLAQMRLGAQAQAPSTYRYPAPFVERVETCLAAHDLRRIMIAPLISEAVQ